MASRTITSVPARPQPDPKVAIQYGLLVKKAEDVQPAQTIYKSGDEIVITYDAINLTYKVVTTFYLWQRSRDRNPSRPGA
jgi:hypothetical protein